MTPKKTWLAITLGFYLVAGLSYHLYLTGNPRQILVAVDTSFNMQSKEAEISSLLGKIERSWRYATFSLVTDKVIIHPWRKKINSGTLSFYGMRNLDGFFQGSRKELENTADRRVLITDASKADLKNFRGWKIYRLD